MASSVYSEVTSVSTYGYERDRVLDKLKTASKDLPYSVDDITISHNDFAVADVYNDSLRKLYSNYLFLIANAEISSTSTPLSAASNYIAIKTNGRVEPQSIGLTPNVGLNHTQTLSALGETFITSQTDGTGKLLYFNYAKDDSFVFETNSHITNAIGLLSGNEIEFNKTFKFKDVVSVDVKDNILFVLDKGANTVYKFDITGLITSDKGLKRNSVTDSERPGRYLLKTIGGEGTNQTKNKLSNPNSLSVHEDRVYILDNGHNSIKVFDLDFNFIQEVNSTSLFNNPNYGELMSIVVDKYSDTSDLVQGYVLSSRGKVFTYDVINNTIKLPTSLYDYYDTRVNLLSATDLSNSFNKIVNSKLNKNILYISNKGRIYKYYKTNFKTYISELDLLKHGIAIGTEEDQKEILSFDTTLHNGKEYIAVTTTNYPDQEVSTYVFLDDHATTKLYHENFYTNYFSLSNILVLPQEIVNNVTFNKTTKKLIYNHYSFFENLNKKIYSSYSTVAGLAPFPTLSAIVPHEFTKPQALEENHNLYIGVNEPLLTDVINRPLRLLFAQQEALFDLIKEESLNSNPPADYTIHLPGDITQFPNVVEFKNSSTSVDSGSSIEVEVTRTNILTGAPACSFQYYTVTGTATKNDFYHIESTNPAIGKFTKNVDSVTIPIDTELLYGSGTKSFSIVLKSNTNCIIGDKNTHTINMSLRQPAYTISLSASDGNLSEEDTARVEVKRVPTSGTDILTAGDTSVNISIDPTNIVNNNYRPNVSFSTIYSVVDDKLSDFPLVRAAQTSAAKVNSTSTIFFTDTITSVIFDLSAANTPTATYKGTKLTVKLNNPSKNSTLGNTSEQVFRIGDTFKTTNLFLSSISATYRADGTSSELLSCVNIWEALSASTAENNGTAFSTFSATNPYIVNFTVHEPLSIFSVDVLSAALQFKPDHDLIFPNNEINIIVNEGAGVVGKGGRGGYGALYRTGFSLVSSGSDADDASIDTHDFDPLVDGGPAIGNIDMGRFFIDIHVKNYGHVFGGSGGGGGGVVGVSASTMENLTSLSAGCGGGGGAGIHIMNVGTGGLAAVSGATTDAEDAVDDTVYSQHPLFANIFLSNGSDGAVNGAGGSGGAFTNAAGAVSLQPTGSVNISAFPSMSGLDGGQLGEDGGSDSETVAILPGDGHDAGSSFSTVSSEYSVRRGGTTGGIFSTMGSNILSSGSTGTFKGPLMS